MTRAPRARALGGRRATFIDGFSFAFDGDGDAMTGESRLDDGLRVTPGGPVRLSALATLADIVAGSMASRAIQPRLALTLDLGVDVVGDTTAERLSMSASMLKAGRSTVVTEVEFRPAGLAEVVAISQLTFVPSPRPTDLIPPGLSPGSSAGHFERPWAEEAGARVVEPGTVEIERREFVTQLSGTIQGGIVALISELAAESLTGAPVVGAQTRYLNSVRVGPGRATARALGGGVVRVEVRDAGNDGRLAALTMARTAPAR